MSKQVGQNFIVWKSGDNYYAFCQIAIIILDDIKPITSAIITFIDCNRMYYNCMHVMS